MARLGLVCGFVLGAAIAASGPAGAQQFPFQRYDLADGLAHDRVLAIHQDAKGYLWFATWEGLSRFDGYRFVNYGTRDGLGHALINDVQEDAAGRLWVATQGGVSRLIDDEPGSPSERSAHAAGKAFINFIVGTRPEANQVNRVRFDADGTLWCATDSGVYRAHIGADGNPRFSLASSPETSFVAALRDRRGRLWMAGGRELIAIVDGSARLYSFDRTTVPDHDIIRALADDRDGELLLATDHALFRVIDGRPQPRPLTLTPSQRIRAMLLDAAGALWVGTTDGLIRLHDRQTTYTAREGLAQTFVASLLEDRGNRLWVGTWSRGVYRFAGEAVANFTRAEGLPNENITTVFAGHDGRIYASVASAGIVEIEGRRATHITGTVTGTLDADRRSLQQDQWGDWWLANTSGVWRFRGPHLQFHDGHRVEIPTSPTAAPVGLHADGRGPIWISLSNGDVCRVSPTSQGAAPEIVCRASPQAIGFGRVFADRLGTIWLGSATALVRERAGLFETVQPTPTLPETEPRAFLQDRRGRLWIGLRNHGVSVTDHPDADRLSFTNYSTANGLASDAVWCVAEDAAGRIYLGTGRGLHVMEPMLARTRRFTAGDGLASDNVVDCLVDRRGYLWLATSAGVTRFETSALEQPSQPPPIYLTRIQAGTESVAFAAGAARAPSMVLSASRNPLRIEYVGLDFTGPRLRYQYTLEGLDQAWSPPTDERTVTYSSLAPGAYNFRVRAVTADGVPSDTPASFALRILPPVWQRWWFVGLVALGVVAGSVSAHRLRLRRALGLERLRMQIASDLHDDIGSGLAQIAILSELAKRRAGARSAPLLDEMADIARAGRAAMGDIVWAIDPRKDQIADLVQRLRQTAFAGLEPHGLAVEFLSPDPSAVAGIGLTPDLRRHVLLIVKEAVTNIVRHARASRVWIAIVLEDHHMHLSIRDDGCGFETSLGSEGRGLTNMRTRAAALGASLGMRSAPSAGTELVIDVPLKRPAW